jgi:RimJ/RimL family protein N-acetyltransferase
MKGETEGLIRRPVLKEDLDELARIYAKPEVDRYTSLTGHITREQSHRIVDRSVGLWERFGYGPWTAIDKETYRPDWPDAPR